MSNAATSGNAGRAWGTGNTAGARGIDAFGSGLTGVGPSGRPAKNRDTGPLGWLLDDLVDRIAQVQHVLILSNDGLVTDCSRDLDVSDAEHLAAVSSGVYSLAKGAGRHFGAGSVRQTMIEFDDGFLFVTAAGHGSCLSILTGEGTDVGQMAYEMTLLVHRVGEHLGVAPRHTDGAPTGT